MAIEPLVLDYSHYVEVVDQEECACFSRFPSDLVRAADRLGAVVEGPLRFFPGNLGSQIVEYFEERIELFGPTEYYKDCPYCKARLRSVHEENRAFNPVFGRIMVQICPACGWWESSDECLLEQREDGWYRAREIRRRALLREFSVGGSETPLESLRQHIARHPDDLRRISPHKLEELVGKIFGEFMDCEAIHLGGPSDGGIDLLLINGEHTYVVQVKRRTSPRATEAVGGIREFLGAMLLRGIMKGLFASTAPRFSTQAEAAAREAQRRQLVEYIELVDAQKLIDVCQLTTCNVEPPWKPFSSRPEDPPPQFPDHVYFAFPVERG